MGLSLELRRQRAVDEAPGSCFRASGMSLLSPAGRCSPSTGWCWGTRAQGSRSLGVTADLAHVSFSPSSALGSPATQESVVESEQGMEAPSAAAPGRVSEAASAPASREKRARVGGARSGAPFRPHRGAERVAASAPQMAAELRLRVPVRVSWGRRWLCP